MPFTPVGVSRLLSNKMYIGIQQQKKTEVVDFLDGKIKRNDPSEYVDIVGDFEPIISEDDFNTVQRMKKERLNKSDFGQNKEPEKVEPDSLMV